MIRDIDRIFDGMVEFVESDRLIHGSYINSHDAGGGVPLCGGPRACLVGSLWVSYVAVEDLPVRPMLISEAYTAGDYLADHPALARAYDALNEVAEEWLAARCLSTENDGWSRPMEALFERVHGDGDGDYHGPPLDDRDLLVYLGEARARALINAGFEDTHEEATT